MDCRIEWDHKWAWWYWRRLCVCSTWKQASKNRNFRKEKRKQRELLEFTEKRQFKFESTAIEFGETAKRWQKQYWNEQITFEIWKNPCKYRSEAKRSSRTIAYGNQHSSNCIGQRTKCSPNSSVSLERFWIHTKYLNNFLQFYFSLQRSKWCQFSQRENSIIEIERRKTNGRQFKKKYRPKF